MSFALVEVRDSRTGYFVPARYGTGLRPDGRVVGTPPPSLGNSGRHSGQETIIRGVPEVLGSWWEMFENEDRGSTQNFAARLVSIVVWPAEPFLEKLPNFKKCTLFENGHFQHFHIFFPG